MPCGQPRAFHVPGIRVSGRRCRGAPSPNGQWRNLPRREYASIYADQAQGVCAFDAFKLRFDILCQHRHCADGAIHMEPKIFLFAQISAMAFRSSTAPVLMVPALPMMQNGTEAGFTVRFDRLFEGLEVNGVVAFHWYLSQTSKFPTQVIQPIFDCNYALQPRHIRSIFAVRHPSRTRGH